MLLRFLLVWLVVSLLLLLMVFLFFVRLVVVAALWCEVVSVVRFVHACETNTKTRFLNQRSAMSKIFSTHQAHI